MLFLLCVFLHNIIEDELKLLKSILLIGSREVLSVSGRASVYLLLSLFKVRVSSFNCIPSAFSLQSPSTDQLHCLQYTHTHLSQCQVEALLMPYLRSTLCFCRAASTVRRTCLFTLQLVTVFKTNKGPLQCNNILCSFPEGPL